MPALQAFRVLTEFKFEIGSALVGATQLEGAVDKVSGAAQRLQGEIARIGIGFAGQLGLGAGGAIGTLANIVRQFDMIEKQQIKMGGIFFANRGFIDGIDSAADALRDADKFMLKIAKDAEKFGLNEAALAQFASLGIGITTKEGISPEKNVQFARNILKAAPQLGVNAFDAQGQITRALLGGASTGDPAFRAVAQETEVFKEFTKKVGGMANVTKAFNKLKTVERFNLLNKAFGQFTQNAELLERQANTLSSLVLRIKQSLFGLNGVFKPFGDVIVPLIKDALQLVVDFIKGPFREILANSSVLLKTLAPDLKTFVIRLQQLTDASSNFRSAGIAAMVTEIISWAFGVRILRFAIGALVGGGLIASLGAVVGTLVGIPVLLFKLRRVFAFLGGAVASFLKPFLIFAAIFDIFSRARAIAKIEDAKKFPELAARFSEITARLSRAFAILIEPVDKIFNSIAGFLSPIFEVSFLVEKLVDVFETLENAIIGVIGGMIGAITALIAAGDNLLKGNFAKAFSAEEFAKVFDFSSGEFFKDVIGREKFEGSTTSSVVNINKVENRFDFKEKIEPDRVAFTVVDQIRKLANNRTSAARPFSQATGR